MTERSATLLNFFVDKYFQNIFLIITFIEIFIASINGSVVSSEQS